MQTSLTPLMLRQQAGCIIPGEKLQKCCFWTIKSSNVDVWLSVGLYGHMQFVTEGTRSGLGVVLKMSLIYSLFLLLCHHHPPPPPPKTKKNLLLSTATSETLRIGSKETDNHLGAII